MWLIPAVLLNRNRPKSRCFGRSRSQTVGSALALILVKKKPFRFNLSISFTIFMTYKTLINPAPVCAHMIQILVQTWRGRGCSIFIETNVNKTVKPLAFQSVQHSSVHRTYSAQHNYFTHKNSKKCAPLRHISRTYRVPRED